MFFNRDRILPLMEADVGLRNLEKQHQETPTDETHSRLIRAYRQAGRHDDANRIELRPYVEAYQAAHSTLLDKGPRYGYPHAAVKFDQANKKLKRAAHKLLTDHDPEYAASRRHYIAHGYKGLKITPDALLRRTVSRSLDPKLSNREHFVDLLSKVHGAFPSSWGRTHSRIKISDELDVPGPPPSSEFKNALDYHKAGHVVDHVVDHVSDAPDNSGDRRLSGLNFNQLTVNYRQHGKHTDPGAGKDVGPWGSSPYNQDFASGR